MKSLRFIDLFAGMGGFHRALTRVGHYCVFASEIDTELRKLYLENFPGMRGKVFGDIRDPEVKSKIPDHDILCAGFPCQPFSKSGTQLGTKDETRGTLFHELLDILEDREPKYVLLENVGNFGRHDGGRTWRIVRDQLEKLGYVVGGTEHRTPMPRTDWRDVGRGTEKPSKRLAREFVEQEESEEGHGLISPHHFGYPHHRERFFVVAALGGLPEPLFPRLNRNARTSLVSIVQPKSDLTAEDRRETALTVQQRACIDHWNKLVKALPKGIELPSFPIWGDELAARYPFEHRTPWATKTAKLRRQLKGTFRVGTRKSVLMQHLPSYAREQVPTFRHWKVRYIAQNREWWAKVRPYLPKRWAKTLRKFPASLRKLEWNAKGGERDLWRYVLQFRPSGLRVKRYTSSPALVAMTATQIPILGRKERFITRVEALRLQGFPEGHRLPRARERAFQALGNAVHVHVVARIAKHVIAHGSLDSDGKSRLRGKRSEGYRAPAMIESRTET